MLMFGCPVAREVGIRRVVSPNYPGNLCALGLLASNLRHELVRTHLSLLESADMTAVGERLGQMIKEAHALLAGEAVVESARDISCVLGVRYEGQAHELLIEVAPGRLDRAEIGRLFTEQYFKTWSYSPSGRPIQLVTLRVIAVGRAPKLEFPRLDGKGLTLAKAETGRRHVYFEGASRDTPVYRRTALPPGASFRGPAIVEESGATTVVFPDWDGRVDDYGNIILEAR
jgi:N-methylhydantoinase A